MCAWITRLGQLIGAGRCAVKKCLGGLAGESAKVVQNRDAAAARSVAYIISDRRMAIAR